jgi:hypothetical protein
MGLPIMGAENEMPDNDPHVPGVTAGGAGGFSVWSPRPSCSASDFAFGYRI